MKSVVICLKPNQHKYVFVWLLNEVGEIVVKAPCEICNAFFETQRINICVLLV